MNIDILSGIIKRLVLANGEVSLPGIGTFVTEDAPATFSDKGFTINPPYRKLLFRERIELDNLLAEAYSKENMVGIEESSAVIREFMEGLRMELEARKSIYLPGLGRLRATKENNFFFIADEDIDIFPDGFGLEAISLKSHIVADPIEIYPIARRPEEEEPQASDGESAKGAENAKDTESAKDTENAEQEAGSAKPGLEKAQAAEPESKKESGRKMEALFKQLEERKDKERNAAGEDKGRLFASTGKILLWIIAGAGLLLATFMLLSDFAPELMDSLLYTKEELEILNY